MSRAFEDGQNRVITILGYKAGLWVNDGLEAMPVSEPITGDPRFPYAFRPDVSEWMPTQNTTHSPVNILAYPSNKLPDMSNSAITLANPQQTITMLLSQAHDDFPASVGPPYTIIHVTVGKTLPKARAWDSSVTKARIQWVERGACPGWNTEVVAAATSEWKE